MGEATNFVFSLATVRVLIHAQLQEVLTMNH